MEEYKALSRGAFINTLGQLFRLTRALSLILFARFLGAKDFGLYFLVWSLTEIVQNLSLLGFPGGALWQASELAAHGKNAEIRPTLLRLFTVGTLIGAAAVSFVYLFADATASLVLKKPEAATPWFIFCLTTPFYNGSRILLSGLRTTLKMHYEVLVCYVLEPLVVLTIGAATLLAGWQLIGCVVAHLAAAIAGWILSLVFFQRVYPPTNHPAVSLQWKKFLSYSLYLGGVDLLQLFKQRLDLLVLGRFLPLEAVGIYGAVSEIGFVIRKIRNIFDTILLPILARLRALKDRERLRKKFIVTIRWVLIVSLSYYGVLWIAPAPILKIFGGGFEAGALALLIFAAGEIVHATLGILECDLQMAGKSHVIFWNWVVTVLINFVLLYGLVPKFGLGGAATATAVTLTVMGLVRVFQIKRLEDFWPFHLSQGKPILVCGMALLICRFFNLPSDLLTIGLYLALFLLIMRCPFCSVEIVIFLLFAFFL